jgi:diketogulonate reductase-like aldo/keto reductase
MASPTSPHATRSIQGLEVPAFLYGTAWKEERTRELTEQSLEVGFAGIDTANQRKHYVEAAVGEAVQAALSRGRITRSQLFLQTKFTFARGQDHRIPYDPGAPYAAQVERSFESSLEHLATSYVDAYLLHGPASARGFGSPDWEVWRSLEALHRSGRARLIGVSNVSLSQLSALCEGAAVPPAFVQNRCHASTGWDRDVRAYCRQRGIGYQAFSVLTANRRELAGPVVTAIARRLGRTPAQVAFRFALQVGMIILTGSSSAEHLRQDLDCYEFELSAADVAQLEAIGES